jgi:regulator of replication initiation timing
MLTKVWYSIFNKKEENNMPEVSKKAVDNLKQQVTVCNEQIAYLRSRISELADDNKVMTTQLTNLKATVAEDIKYLYDKVG